MDIQQKIEAIRRQPEHVRLKYVWVCVGVCMVAIIALWLFSVTTSFQKTQAPAPFPDTVAPLSETPLPSGTNNTPSLEDWVKQGQQPVQKTP